MVWGITVLLAVCGNALWFVIYIVAFSLRKTFCFSLGRNFPNPSQTGVEMGGDVIRGLLLKDIEHQN